MARKREKIIIALKGICKVTMASSQSYLEYPAGKIPQGQLCETCARFNNRHITCCVVTLHQGKVLLVLRDQEPMRRYWGLPGGYLDWDETVEECAKRELLEETGLTAEVVKFFRISSDPERDPDGRQNVECVYIASHVSGEMQAEEGEVAQLQWFDLDTLPNNIAFDHKQVLADIALLEE